MSPPLSFSPDDEESVAPHVIPDAPSEHASSQPPSTLTSHRSASASEASLQNISSKGTIDKTRSDSPTNKSPVRHEHSHGLEAVKSAAHTAKRKLHLDSIHTSGPSNFFNPTNVRVHVRWKNDDEGEKHDGDDSGVLDNGHALLWRSRDNRKGRNSIAVPYVPVRSRKPLLSRAAAKAKEVARNILRMLFSFNYWDMAFWSGWAYTWGSVLFVMDGSWAFTEVAFPETEPESLSKYGGPLCFFFGALLYQVGAVMAYLEAVNDGSFQGSAMRRLLEGHEDDARKMLDARIHSFFSRLVHHGKDEEDVFPPGDAPLPRRGAIDLGAADEGTSTTYLTWRWWPSWYCLKTHHVYEIGYLACAIQLFGATLYAICGVVTLPGILSSLEHWQKEGAFWVPQIVASVCFLTAGILFTLETQERWWKPEPTVIGWWIGIWATVGSMGFLLCAIFGSAQYDVPWGEYQSDLSSTWGSFAYLLSGVLQWYESTNKRPIEELFNEPGEMKSYQVHAL